jgi:hypothetical protein
MQRGIQGSLMDLEEVLRDLLKALRDGIAVARAKGHNLEHQHVESSSEELDLGFAHGYT